MSKIPLNHTLLGALFFLLLPGAPVSAAPSDGPTDAAAPLQFSRVTAPDDASSSNPAASSLLPIDDADQDGEWRWRRADTANYVGVGIFGGAALYIESEHGSPKAKWKDKNGFDDSIRSALRLKSRGDRNTAHRIGDILMWGMIAAPVVDAFAVQTARDRSWDTIWQTQAVNLESYTFTSFVSSLLQNVIAREKPFVRNCTDGLCEGDHPTRSMPSGHVAFAFTGAGLVCNHHKYQSLYGEQGADDAACATGIVLASADGIARIMADHHYATDVLAGSAIGIFSGFMLPRLLHYSHLQQNKPQPRAKNSFIKDISLTPFVSESGTGLNCEFRF